MSSSGDGDRSRNHLGVSQSSKTTKKKAKRLIYPEDIPGQLSSTPEQHFSGTHIHVIPVGTGDPLAYHSQCRRPRDTSSSSQFLHPLHHSYLPTQMMPRPQLLASNRVSSDTSYPVAISPHLSSLRLRDFSNESNTRVGTPPLTQHYLHLRASPSSSLVASFDKEQGTLELAAGEKDRFGRVMIEPDGASWHPSKDAVRALQESVRRLYTESYHSWREIPERIRQAMFNEFKTMCTWKPKYNMVIATTFERKASAKLSRWLKKARNTKTPGTWLLPNVFEELCRYWNTDEFKNLSEQAKKGRNSFRDGSSHIRCAKSVGTITKEMKKASERTPLCNEIFKRTRVKKKLNESNPDEWIEERAEQTYREYEQQLLEMGDHVQLTPEESTQLRNEKVVGGRHKGKFYGMDSRNDVGRLQSGLQGIGSSRQGEALDDVYIAAMSQQIAQLTHALAESEAKRVVEQENMKNTIEQIKEQALNLALRPTMSRSSSESTPTEDIESDEEDEYIYSTP